jgi:hypothetical protein
MDSSNNSGNEFVKNVFNRELRTTKLASTSQTIEVDTFTSKILSVGVILLIAITLIIGFTALRRSPTPVSQIAGDNLNVENFDLIEHLETDKKDLEQLKREQIQLKADIDALRKRQPTQINKITQNKIIAPANRTAGTHYAIGPMIPKISSNSQLTCPSRTDTRATPLLKKNIGFITPDRTWAYEIDGTIRTAYNKTIDKMGSCMQVLDNNNINMTENNNNCSKWTWNAKGQLRYVSSQGGHPKCLTVGKIKDSPDDGVYVSHCTDHASKVWSFFSTPSVDNN